MITINIVSQSGHAWTEEFQTVEDAKEAIPSIVSEHGDIERVELLDENGLNPENIWTME